MLARKRSVSTELMTVKSRAEAGKTILFTDHGQDWSDERIVLAYRVHHHVEADFRRLRDPRYLGFRPTFHWTDQKLRVHAFYCVLALMILNLLRRKLAQSCIVLSIVEIMKQLTEINEVTLLYPAPQPSKEPVVQTQLSKMNDLQEKWLPSSVSTDFSTIRSYRLDLQKPVRRAAESLICASGLVNSG
jgi:transposase